MSNFQSGNRFLKLAKENSLERLEKEEENRAVLNQGIYFAFIKQLSYINRKRLEICILITCFKFYYNFLLSLVVLKLYEIIN